MLFWNKHYVDCKCTQKPKFNSLIAITNCTPKTTHFLDFCAKLQGFFSHADTEIGCNFFSFPVCKPLAYRLNYTKKIFFCNSLLRLWKCLMLNTQRGLISYIEKWDVYLSYHNTEGYHDHQHASFKSKVLVCHKLPYFFIFSFDDSVTFWYL